MPKGPQGQKRPADAIARAVMVAKIATGEAEDPAPSGNAVFRAIGKRGGEARAKALSKEQKDAIAKRAAKARWTNEN